MGLEVLKVLEPGLGASLQDQGRSGWRRFGVPSIGAMDDHAASWANRLLDNTPSSPVLELLLQGAKLAVLHDIWVALTGADAEASIPMWQAVHVHPGQLIQFPHNHRGSWCYVGL